MTKADLIAAIEKQAHLTHKQAEMVVNICFDSMIFCISSCTTSRSSCCFQFWTPPPLRI